MPRIHSSGPPLHESRDIQGAVGHIRTGLRENTALEILESTSEINSINRSPRKRMKVKNGALRNTNIYTVEK